MKSAKAGKAGKGGKDAKKEEKETKIEDTTLQQEAEPIKVPPAPEEKQENKNIERVLIPRLAVKKVVSHHSSTILAEPPPMGILDEEQRNKALSAFQSIADSADNTISKEKIVTLLIELGSKGDAMALQPIVDRLGATLQDKLTQEEFVHFYDQFLAPEYFYGQHMRMYASRGCIAEMTELILRQCQINSGDGEGLTCLHHACEYNRLDVLEALLQIGKGDLVINAQDKYGWTPLHCASHHGSAQCVKRLLTCDNINLKLKDKVGKTCLHLACAQNRSAIVPLLLQKDPDLINTVDDVSMTPIHEAAYRGHVALFQELTKYPRADLMMKDKLDRLSGDYFSSE